MAPGRESKGGDKCCSVSIADHPSLSGAQEESVMRRRDVLQGALSVSTAALAGAAMPTIARARAQDLNFQLSWLYDANSTGELVALEKGSAF
jgi:hypothetical protein